MGKALSSYLQGLNQEQLAVVRHADGPAAVFAGPGSGKTKTLISRLLHLVIEQRVNPEQIVVTTFTQRAARELRERIDQISRGDDRLHRSMKGVSIGTIHSFCLKLLAQFGYLSDASCTNLVNLEDNDILLLLSVHGQELGLTFQEYKDFLEKMGGISRSRNDHRSLSYQDLLSEIASQFSLLSESLYSDLDLEQLAKENYESAFIVNRYQKYQALTHELGILDHSLILKRAHELLEKSNSPIEKVQETYTHFLIDEFQDTNLVQDRIFRLLSGKFENLMVVGDEDQSIYGFRGARVELFRNFASRWTGKKPVTEYLLEGNYRSGRRIVEHFNAFKESAFGINTSDSSTAQKKRSRPLRSEDGEVVLLKADEEELLAEAMLQRIRTLKRSRSIDSYASVAVLYRSDTGSTGKILKHLKSLRDRRFRDVEIEFSSDRRMLKNETVRVFLELIERIADKVESPKKGRKVAQSIADEADRIEKTVDSSEIMGWIASRQQLKKQAYVHRIVSFLLRQQSFKEFIPNGDATFASSGATFYLGKVSEEAARFDRIVRKRYQCAAGTLRAFLRYLEAADQTIESAQSTDGVQVLTFHKAKGLEWPVVFLLEPETSLFSPRLPEDSFHGLKLRILNGAGWRSTAPVEQQEECNRLLYVAQSRARSLLIYAATEGCDIYSGLQTVLERVPSWQPIVEPLQVDKLERKPIVVKTSHSDLVSHQGCGLRYQIEKLYGFEGKPLPQLYEGKSVHRALQTVHEGWKAGREFTDSEARVIFSQSWIRFGQSRNANSKRWDHLLALFLSYCANPPAFITENRIDAIEFEVSTELMTSAGAIRLEGRLDLALLQDRKPVLVEFKLDQAEDDLAIAELQLAAYQIALGYDRCLRVVYSLEAPKTFELPVLSLDECRNALLPSVESLTKNIAKDHFPSTPSLAICGKCNLADFCPSYNLKKTRRKPDQSFDPAA